MPLQIDLHLKSLVFSQMKLTRIQKVVGMGVLGYLHYLIWFGADRVYLIFSLLILNTFIKYAS
jgi:hypothetical protein